jgi:hypothetical protein
MLTNRCWIITCDSLGGQHRAVKTVLERWLQFEARDKLQTTYRLSDASYVEAKVSSPRIVSREQGPDDRSRSKTTSLIAVCG